MAAAFCLIAGAFWLCDALQGLRRQLVSAPVDHRQWPVVLRIALIERGQRAQDQHLFETEATRDCCHHRRPPRARSGPILLRLDRMSS